MSYLKRLEQELSINIDGERRLLVAMLQQALTDLGSTNKREASLGWITDLHSTVRDKWSFVWIVEQLDLDIEEVNKYVKRIINGQVWSERRGSAQRCDGILPGQQNIPGPKNETEPNEVIGPHQASKLRPYLINQGWRAARDRNRLAREARVRRLRVANS